LSTKHVSPLEAYLNFAIVVAMPGQQFYLLHLPIIAGLHFEPSRWDVVIIEQEHLGRQEILQLPFFCYQE
jgi:hypothetical protein